MRDEAIQVGRTSQARPDRHDGRRLGQLDDPRMGRAADAAVDVVRQGRGHVGRLVAGDGLQAAIGHRQPHQSRPAAERRHAGQRHRAGHAARPADDQGRAERALMRIGRTRRKGRQALDREETLQMQNANCRDLVEISNRTILPLPSLILQFAISIHNSSPRRAAFLAIIPATYPPLNPASIFTTLTFEAQLFSIPSSAASPPKAAP